jgi:hypothetical protein
MEWLWRRIAQHVTPVPSQQIVNTPRDGATPEGIVREAAARQLDAQISTNDVLDSRNMNIVTVGSTVLPLTFGLLAIGQVEIPKWAGRSLKVSLAAYVLLLLTSWWASRFRGLGYRPDLFDLINNSQSYSAPLLEQWVAIEYSRSTEENEQVLKRKARWVGTANTLLYLEGLLLSIAAMLTLL